MMRGFSFGAAVLLVSSSSLTMAQQPSERSFNLTVTQSQLGLIGAALGELPYNKAAPVIQSITGQIEAQNRPPAVVAAPADAPGPDKPQEKQP